MEEEDGSSNGNGNANAVTPTTPGVPQPTPVDPGATIVLIGFRGVSRPQQTDDD